MKRTARSSEARRKRSDVSAAPAAARPVPERTCVACKSKRAKRELVRIVRSPAGELSVDLRGKAAGRGAYCDPVAACLERGLREGAIARALEVTIDDATADRLRDEMNNAAQVRNNEEKR
ncbi:MAG TPA: YlxR family protein [Candidatus Limnocylindrales bacterium]|nr:YlxR family protein [Candidatus Limnocylindrales bacterium]